MSESPSSNPSDTVESHLIQLGIEFAETISKKLSQYSNDFGNEEILIFRIGPNTVERNSRYFASLLEGALGPLAFYRSIHLDGPGKYRPGFNRHPVILVDRSYDERTLKKFKERRMSVKIKPTCPGFYAWALPNPGIEYLNGASDHKETKS